MKKTALFAMFFLLNSLMIFGQLSFGPKIGLNVNRLSTDMGENVNILKEQSKSGLQLGAFARLGGKTYFQPELMISGRGGKFNLTATGGSGIDNYEYSMTALDIPLLIGNKLLNTPVAKLRVFAGPVASFALNKKLKINNLSATADEIKLKDAVWAATLGAGVDVLMFTFDVRYEIGLNNISTETGQSIKPRMFNVSLGWKIL
ncbi:MAG: porin family protein [Bacteroidales bacterium]